METQSFTADMLRDSPAKLQEIDRHVREIVESLNIEIKEAHENGCDFIESSITNTFIIPYMKQEDALIHIQYRILRDFTDRKFRVFIRRNKDNSDIIIAWVSKADIQRLKDEKAFIDSCAPPKKPKPRPIAKPPKSR